MLLPTSPQFLHLQSERCGAHGGIFSGDRHETFGALGAAADTLSAWLARRGYGAGDPVGLMMPNTPALVGATFAVWGIGGVTVPIATRSTAAEAAQLLTHSRASALMCDAARADVARDAAKSAGIAAYVAAADASERPRILCRGRRGTASTARPPRPSDLATIAYTSGTTGAPKGVLVSHANLLWATLACGQARGDRPEGVGACISPLTHTPVFVSHLLCRILVGASAVLLEKFDLGVLLATVERHGVTDLPLIGGMVFDVVTMGSVAERVRRSVQKVSVGGAPTPMDAKRALAAIFDHAEIIEAYGQSESTDGVAMARGTSVFDHPGTVGTANPYIAVAIRRGDGSLAEVGEDGEIVIGGPTVMQGYYRNRAATAAAVREGWLHTGDLGRRNDSGYFFITGRVKDLIITGGENVSPVEVEDVLRRHPDVADVAVIGTPHPKWGEQVTAVIVPRAGARVEAAALTDFAAAHLAGFKKPRRVEIVDALPRNAANKVQAHLLRERFADGGTRSVVSSGPAGNEDRNGRDGARPSTYAGSRQSRG